MIGYIEAQQFVRDRGYNQRRMETVSKLEENIIEDFDPENPKFGEFIGKVIDPPIINLVRGFDSLEHCFLIQECYGHFLPYTNDVPVSTSNVYPVSKFPESVDKYIYCVAYMLYCVKNDEFGMELLEDLKKLTEINPKYVHLGSLAHTWVNHPNSCILQVQPEQGKREKDQVFVSRDESLIIEDVRNKIFQELDTILQKHRALINA